jgi:hypothetical protein
MNETLLDKRQLRERLNLKSLRSVDEMIRDRKIPVIRLGYRTLRFSWPAVEAALEKLTRKSIA